MSNTNRTIILINDAKKYGESFFLCNCCAKEAERLAASMGGFIVRTTEPNLSCSVCREPNARLEFRAK